MIAIAASGVDTGLLGSFYTAISVVIVYHLLSLQQWLQDVTAAEAECETTRATAVGDYARARASARCDRVAEHFPWLQISVVGAGVTVLCGIALFAACDLAEPAPSPIYTMLPTATLWLVFVSATVGARVQGARRLTRAQSLVA